MDKGSSPGGHDSAGQRMVNCHVIQLNCEKICGHNQWGGEKMLLEVVAEKF